MQKEFSRLPFTKKDLVIFHLPKKGSVIFHLPKQDWSSSINQKRWGCLPIIKNFEVVFHSAKLWGRLLFTKMVRSSSIYPKKWGCLELTCFHTNQNKLFWYYNGRLVGNCDYIATSAQLKLELGNTRTYQNICQFRWVPLRSLKNPRVP